MSVLPVRNELSDAADLATRILSSYRTKLFKMAGREGAVGFDAIEKAVRQAVEEETTSVLSPTPAARPDPFCGQKYAHPPHSWVSVQGEHRCPGYQVAAHDKAVLSNPSPSDCGPGSAVTQANEWSEIATRAIELLHTLHENTQGERGLHHHCSSYCEIREFLLDHEVADSNTQDAPEGEQLGNADDRGGPNHARSRGAHSTVSNPSGSSGDTASPGACGRCGKDPADGWALINFTHYCHEGPSPTCYELESWTPRTTEAPAPTGGVDQGRNERFPSGSSTVPASDDRSGVELHGGVDAPDLSKPFGGQRECKHGLLLTTRCRLCEEGPEDEAGPFHLVCTKCGWIGDRETPDGSHEGCPYLAYLVEAVDDAGHAADCPGECEGKGYVVSPSGSRLKCRESSLDAGPATEQVYSCASVDKEFVHETHLWVFGSPSITYRCPGWAGDDVGADTCGAVFARCNSVSHGGIHYDSEKDFAWDPDGTIPPFAKSADGASHDMTLNAVLHRFWGLEPCETACTCIIKSGGRIDGHSILGLANTLTRATVKATKTAGLTEGASDG